MSRIGKKPIPLPKDVTVNITGTTVAVKGPRGELNRTFVESLTFAIEDGEIVVSRASDEPQQRALHGLSRALLANMVEGVTKGYRRQLEINGVGYKAEPRPNGLLFSLGYSHTIEYKAPAGIKLTAPQPTQVLVEGCDKAVVGQVASEIRALRPPEPYKGKGIRYAGEAVRRKAGKAGGK